MWGDAANPPLCMPPLWWARFCFGDQGAAVDVDMYGPLSQKKVQNTFRRFEEIQICIRFGALT